MIIISNDFCHKIKIYNFEPYNVLLSIATNIAVLLMTASVLQGHIYIFLDMIITLSDYECDSDSVMNFAIFKFKYMA